MARRIQANASRSANPDDQQIVREIPAEDDQASPGGDEREGRDGDRRVPGRGLAIIDHITIAPGAQERGAGGSMPGPLGICRRVSAARGPGDPASITGAGRPIEGGSDGHQAQR